MTISHEVKRTGVATYVYLPSVTPAGSAIKVCIGWARAMVADPSTWEVRIPTTGPSDWTAVDACAGRVAAERKLSELTGRTL